MPKLIRNRVQLWNPVTKKWVKVDTTTGRIMAYRKGAPYKNIKIVEPRTRHKPSARVRQVRPKMVAPVKVAENV